MSESAASKIVIFDTTLRDGELTPGVTMNLHQKLSVAKLLEAMRVDVIEVGYPGVYQKDFDELVAVSQAVQNSVVCGLASSKRDEIDCVGQAIKSAAQGRINLFTPINLNSHSDVKREHVLDAIQTSIKQARDYCDDVEWNAFDATRSDPDFICKTVETAIQAGATTICIPDSLGVATPDTFTTLLELLFNRVSRLDQVSVAVHCHDDLGFAVENSIAALTCGVTQIECSINGLGARAGNADLAEVVNTIDQNNQRGDRTHQTQPAPHPHYQLDIDTTLLQQASDLVSQTW
ncbi:MAG TPA: hypothetical protein V6C78_29575 [Crinalium sp.]|jgi:2-isopropylmalate synthase